MADFAFKVHMSTKVSPFFINYEQEPRMGFELKSLLRRCKSNTRKPRLHSKGHKKKYADKNRKEVIKATKVEMWSLHFKLQEEPKLYCLDIQEEPKRKE